MKYKKIYVGRFIEIANMLGIGTRVVPGAEFAADLCETAKAGGTAYIFESFINDMEDKEELNYESNIHMTVGDVAAFIEKQ